MILQCLSYYPCFDENGWLHTLCQILLIFTLSAVPPVDMKSLLEAAYNALAPEGHLLIRDYGLYDMAMLRFPYAQCLDDRSQISRCPDAGGCQYFMRKDGTLSYFFDLVTLATLCESVGFTTVSTKVSLLFA